MISKKEYVSGIKSDSEIPPLDLGAKETVAFLEMKAGSCSEVFIAKDVNDLLRLDLYQKYLDFIEVTLYPETETDIATDERVWKRQAAHEFADDYLEYVLEKSGVEPAMTPPYISRMRSTYEEMSQFVYAAELADLSR